LWFLITFTDGRKVFCERDNNHFFLKVPLQALLTLALWFLITFTDGRKVFCERDNNHFFLKVPLQALLLLLHPRP